jgi:hypothetical protein
VIQQDLPLAAAPTRADQILARFVSWARTSGPVVGELEALALGLASNGAARISINALVELVRVGNRWEVNNDFRAYLARLLILRHPHLEPLIERRRRPSARHPAYAVDLERLDSQPAGPELDIGAELEALARELWPKP